MARYQVQGPDGQVHVFEGPDGATPDQVTAVAKQMFSAQSQKIASQIANDPISQGARDFNSGTGDLENFVAGYGKAGTDLARGAGQWLGLVNRGDVAESRKLDSALMKTKAGTAGDILGNVVDLAPLALLPGAASIPGGAAIGAVTGLLQPSTSTTETVANGSVGALAGAAVPAAQRLWQITKAAVEPFSQAGQNRIVGRTLNAAAGKDAPQVAQRLADVSQPFVGPSNGLARTMMGEYVPGSIPTVGQASQNAGVAALERAATANNPAVTNAVSDTMNAQNAARVSLLNDVSGAGGGRDFFDAARQATGNQMYGQARTAGVDQELAKAIQPQIDSLLRRPSMQQAKSLAQQLAAENDQSITNFGSIEGLDWLKKALDNKISVAARPGSSIGNAELRGLMQTKADLMSTLEQIAPAYKTANDTFAAMSKPITQMDIGQAIANKSINPLSGNLQPAAYARALSDKTAQQVTGMPKATLANSLDSNGMNALNSILLDVQRANGAQNFGRGVGSDTIQKLAYSNLMEQSGVPTFLQGLRPLQVAGNLAARGGDALYGRANKEIAGLLGETMLDPQKAGLLMLHGTPAQRSEALALLARTMQGGLLAAPASAYALEH